jgi:hypothetical protein
LEQVIILFFQVYLVVDPFNLAPYVNDGRKCLTDFLALVNFLLEFVNLQ